MLIESGKKEGCLRQNGKRDGEGVKGKVDKVKGRAKGRRSE